jgi:hypothetical protein
VFQTMVDGGVSIDCTTVVSMLPACAQAKDLRIGRVVHRLVEERGLGAYVAVKNALIRAWRMQEGCLMMINVIRMLLPGRRLLERMH